MRLGALTPSANYPKAEDKVRHVMRRPAPKAPAANGANSRASTQSAADTRTRPRDRQASGAPQSSSTQRTQRRGGGGRGGVGGVTAMRERSLGDIKGKDGGTLGKEDRRGGRLCEESKGKEKERNGHQKSREANGLKGRGTEWKGKGGAKGKKPNNVLSRQEVYLTAMVVPRTPVAPRNQGKTRDRGNEASFNVTFCVTVGL